jgi:hypothetical protein
VSKTDPDGSEGCRETVAGSNLRRRHAATGHAGCKAMGSPVVDMQWPKQCLTDHRGYDSARDRQCGSKRRDAANLLSDGHGDWCRYCLQGH